MLEELRKLRDQGIPDAMLMHLAQYRIEYRKLSFSDRQLTDFGYFMRCKHIEYLRNERNDKGKAKRRG